MRYWLLYMVVGAAVLAVAYDLLHAECGESDNGRHEDMLMSVDTHEGRRWRMKCLHCLRESDGVLIPWLHSR